MEQSLTNLPAAVQRVAMTLREKGVSTEIRMLEQSTRTAQEAADAIGCTIGQIVKSLVFAADDQPFIALVSGENRVDVKKLEKLLQASVRRATANEVKEASGYAIGGVPPLGHASEMRVLVDETLLAYRARVGCCGPSEQHLSDRAGRAGEGQRRHRDRFERGVSQARA